VTNPTATVRTKPRQRRAQERVDALLDAAASLIERGGLDAVTTTAVAAEAGTSVGGLYRYFEDARAILRGLAARNMDRFWAGIDADPPAGAGRAFLAGVMSRYVAFARTEPGFTALRFGQVLDGYGGERTVSTQIAEHLEAAYVRTGAVAPSADLRLDLEIAATMSSALMDLAFAMDPRGDQQVIDRTIELALVLLSRHAQPE
jgi:AcrR family transcriptional regulator